MRSLRLTHNLIENKFDDEDFAAKQNFDLD